MLHFLMTDEVKALLINQLSDSGEVDCEIKRIGENTFELIASHQPEEGERFDVMKLGPFHLKVGDRIELQGMKVGLTADSFD